MGKFKGDFPRGLRISECGDPRGPKQLIDFSSWQGELKYTEAAFPYFGGKMS